VIAGCGTGFAIAEVADVTALAAAAPDVAAFRQHLPAALATGLLLHARRNGADGPRRARMFGPLAGVMEDPATGSAAVALAGLLLATGGGQSLDLALEQGIEMGRPSRLALRAWRDAEGGIRAAVGGEVVAVARGELLID
jgi:trans-2,3-dihydro-3-hydroxyanthranilate isomerase